MIIGFGARHARADRSWPSGSTRRTCAFLPYQPREVLSESLSAADLHFVGLARGLAGYVVPSRMYGILAAGRPVLVSAEDESETARDRAMEAGCGVVVPPGRPDRVAAVIRDVVEGRLVLEGMGARGRGVGRAREADRGVAFARYREVVGSVVARAASSVR